MCRQGVSFEHYSGVFRASLEAAASLASRVQAYTVSSRLPACPTFYIPGTPTSPPSSFATARYRWQVRQRAMLEKEMQVLCMIDVIRACLRFLSAFNQESLPAPLFSPICMVTTRRAGKIDLLFNMPYIAHNLYKLRCSVDILIITWLGPM